MAESVKTETIDMTAEEPANGIKQEDEDDINEMEHLRKLFIGGLAPQTTEENLKKFYGQWGTVVDAVVMRDPATKRSRGFGFITYVKSASVDQAQNNRPHVIDSKTVDSKRALPRPERETKETNVSVKKLFVGGLKDNHDEKSLEDYFTRFGNVISVKILTDRTTGKRRGFAFIEYDDYDSVDKAVLQKVHTIKYAVIDVKKSVYTQEKQFKNAYNDRANNIDGTKQPSNFRPTRPQQTKAPYNQGAPQTPYQQPQYNYWGTPQYPTPPQYGAYQQQPPMPANDRYQQNNWNNGWVAGPAQPSNNNWYANQSPNAQTQAQAPAANWNVAPQPTAGQPANFGTGYQQSYGGGPSKPNPSNSNRMHPYGPAQNANYGNGSQPPPPPPPQQQQQAYNGYGQNPPISAGQNVPPVRPPVNAATQIANKFRR